MHKLDAQHVASLLAVCPQYSAELAITAIAVGQHMAFCLR